MACNDSISAKVLLTNIQKAALQEIFIKLNNRLASLRRSVETGDARPTDGAYKVFKELSLELDTHLVKLSKVMDKHQSKLNSVLQKAGLNNLMEGK